MQFQVPQNIDIEDRIFGKFTFKQFVYVAGGLGGAYFIWKLLPFYIAVVIVVPLVAFAFSLAFFPKEKYGRPFIEIVQSAIMFTSRQHLYTWRQLPKSEKSGSGENVASVESSLFMPRISDSKLKDLSWSIDVKHNARDAGTAGVEGGIGA